MKTAYQKLEESLLSSSSTWLVTGCAGFIGSHLVERLLKLNQKVIGIDSFSTGRKSNIEHIQSTAGLNRANFEFFEGDMCDYDFLEPLVLKSNYILHQAAIGSVPRSIKEPLVSHQANVDGFCNLLVAAIKNPSLRKIAFASSSSVYGDDNSPEKAEENLGNLLSPYALTKKTNELYADVFARTYPLQLVGLRYFNVFGPRQDPEGQYAAVIPKWIDLILNGKKVEVYGDGSTSRDFCYIENVVQANLLAATTTLSAKYEVFNVALNQSTSLKQLLENLIDLCGKKDAGVPVEYMDFRKGDIYHSCASIQKAQKLLGYQPAVFIRDGLLETVKAFRE